MQSDLSPILGIILNGMGIFALILILAYTVYGEEEEE
jgi:hypothetical protein